MGLSICKKILQKSGGKIYCYSAGHNQGSTFIFSMKMYTKEPSSKIKINERSKIYDDQKSDSQQLILPEIKKPRTQYMIETIREASFE